MYIVISLHGKVFGSYATLLHTATAEDTNILTMVIL